MSDHAGNPRTECAPFVPQGIRTLLDVGCSDGLFAELIQRERPGLIVDGVEIDPATATSATPLMRKVFEGSFPEAVPEGVQYDCIAFLDCLEHILEPWDALEEAARRLTPGGTVVASIPNIRHAGALRTILKHKDWPWHDFGTFDRTHVRFFTETSMRRLFEESGYTVTTCAPINESTSPAVRALALLLGKDIKAMQFVLVGTPNNT